MLTKGNYDIAPLNEGFVSDEGSNHQTNNQESSQEREQSHPQNEQETQKNTKDSNHHVSPAIVEKYLSGIHFPCDKNKLIQQAEKNNAPEKVLSLLRDFEKKTYENVTDIAKEVGTLE
jgi:hypothetical protein